MYRTCIFCSADLKANEALERFPVGRGVAFDAEKGRLWAICRKCARWNLAPIEERWEAVEDAERLFRDTRARVQQENIGLARLRDGTRLVRVGPALPGELAVWRYGRKLRERRARYTAAVGVAVALGVGVHAVTAASLITGSGAGVVGMALVVRAVGMWSQWRPRLQSRSLLPYTGLAVDADDLRKARFRFTFDAEVSLALEMREDDLAPNMGLWSDGILVLDAPYARSMLRRGMVELNVAGADARHVATATRLLTQYGSAEMFLRHAAADGLRLDDPALDPLTRNARMLAVEMAVHEELERAALQGELAELEAAWREAEEIAGIADALTDEELEPSEPPRIHLPG